MRNRRRSAFAHSVSALLVALAVGCNSNNTGPVGGGPDGGGVDGGSPDAGSDAGTLGSGNITQSTAVANGTDFALPLDATPSPDGTQIYFTAVQPGSNPGGPAVFKVAAGGGTPTVLTAGGVLGAPLGIAASSDGSKVYLADPAGSTTNDQGAVFSVSTAGGAPQLLTETADYAPRAITVVKVGGTDNIYFIGADKADGTNGIFKDASGTITAVLKGSAAGDPAAVAAIADGTVYVLDSSGTIYKIAPGATTKTALGGGAHDLAVTVPGGMDVSQDGTALLVAVVDPATGKDSVARVVVATGAVTQIAAGLTAVEPGGLHRAINADVYSFVDLGAGNGSGTVYLLKK